MPIIVNLDIMMARRKISLGELAEKIDLTPANLSILKTGKAKAVRFSTLEAICREAGMLAIREGADVINEDRFIAAIRKVRHQDKDDERADIMYL